MKKRIISLFLALAMLLSLLPAVFAVDAQENSIRVWFSVYDAENCDFPVLRRQITVKQDTVKKYGWENAKPGHMVGGVDHSVKDGEISVSDALLAAHEEIYGERFTKESMNDYIVGSASYVMGIFGRTGMTGIGFVVNDRVPVGPMSDGYAANECVLKDGDEVEFFFYGSSWSDTEYLYFDAKELKVGVGEPVTLSLKGINPMEGLWAMPGSETQPVNEKIMANVEIGLYDVNGKLVDYLRDEQGNIVKTDENGRFTYTFDSTGALRLGACSSEDYSNLIASYCGLTAYEVDAQWKNFRNSDTNNGITSVQTPTGKEYAALKWAKKLGTGWSAAPSVQIIVDDTLVVMCGTKKIFKMDLETGETVQEGDMVAAPNWGYTPPAYDDGLVFAPLSGGTVQAFGAKSLRSAWVYTDELGGQSLSPVTVSDGRVYTGFWNSEKKDANFVCLDAKTGEKLWSYTVTGGFYWAGSVAIGDYIVVGTDDGESGTTGDSNLLVFKKYYAEGEEVAPVSSAVLTGCGDQRSTLTYADGKVYFTTKGGYLCSARINEKTGAISELKTVSFGAQSTSTPVVYGDYIYFGTGSGISSSGSSGNFVIADRESLNVVGYVGLKGYPQCSMLLSTAYEESDGYLYFYSTYNSTPGGISLIKVKADDVTKTELVELYDAKGYEQYCITSIVCDNDGNLYYKNDSCNVFCIGRSEIEYPQFTTQPESAVKYEPNTDAPALEVKIQELKEGTLSLQWQRSEDETQWTDIKGATTETLALDTSVIGTVYYRCIASNTVGGETVSTTSDVSAVTIKIFSTDTRPHYAVNSSNAKPGTSLIQTLSYSGAEIGTLGYENPRVWLAAPTDGEILSVEQIEGEDYCNVTEQSGVYAFRLYFGEGVTMPNTFRVTTVSESGVQAVYEFTVRTDALAFRDVRGHWAQEAIEFAYEQGLIDGMGDGYFRPELSMTRAMFVQMLYRLDGEPSISETTDFVDVPQTMWYADAVAWANANGLVLGVDETHFAPEQLLTRQQAVAMLYRYAQYRELDVSATADLSAYSDVNLVQPYALPAMQWANASGILLGRSATELAPTAELRRCETAVLFERFIDFMNPED